MWQSTQLEYSHVSNNPVRFFRILLSNALKDKPKIKNATSAVSSPVSPPHAVPPTPHRPQPPPILIKTEIGIERKTETEIEIEIAVLQWHKIAGSWKLR
ncbi:hypothetical protein ACFX1Q_021092 [Malus domestica]